MLWTDEMGKEAMKGIMSNEVFIARLNDRRKQGGPPVAEQVASVAYGVARSMWKRRQGVLEEVIFEMSASRDREDEEADMWDD